MSACRPLYPIVVVSALLLGLTAAPARAQAVPAADLALTPFTGTAQFVVSTGDPEMPQALRADLGTQRETMTFSVRDADHWRVDLHVTAPVLQSRDETIVADGQGPVAYNTLSNMALQYPGARSASYLLGGLLMDSAPLGTTATRYVALARRNPRVKVRLVGHQQILGRRADIVRISPLVSAAGRGSCRGSRQCVSKVKGYGYELEWLDHQTGLVLRMVQRGVPRRFGFGTFQYAVTSLTVGQGPSDADLAYVPPVPVQPLSGGGAVTGESGPSGPSGFQAPPGFVTVAVPAGMSLDGVGQAFDWPNNGPTSFTVTFRGSEQGIVSVAQQIRGLGLPAALTSGAPIQAGACAAYAGTFPDGVNWVAMQRGQVAILAVATRLAASQLAQYAATGICDAPLSPPLTAQQIEQSALQNLSTEIGITRQILVSAIRAAPNARDRRVLKGFDARLATFDQTVFAMANPGVAYRPPAFGPAQHTTFRYAVSALRGEIKAAQAQLTAAEAAVQSPADRQTLAQQGAVFAELLRAVSAMTR